MTPQERTAQDRTAMWTALIKFNNVVSPFVAAFCIWIVTQIHLQDKRIVSLEDWRGTVGNIHEQASESLRTRIMRDVEQAAATQRESILSQLAALQRDVIRIAVILEIRSQNQNPAGKTGGDKKGDEWSIGK